MNRREFIVCCAEVSQERGTWLCLHENRKRAESYGHGQSQTISSARRIRTWQVSNDGGWQLAA